jgi:hypothetical protein
VGGDGSLVTQSGTDKSGITLKTMQAKEVRNKEGPGATRDELQVLDWSYSRP